MQNKYFLVFLFILSACITGNAQVKGTGIGMSFGEPTAFDLKHWISETSAIEVMTGSSVVTEYYRISLSVDYLKHDFEALKTRSKFPLYYGMGISAASRSDGPMRYGIRGIAGIMWHTARFPVDLYLQTSPTLHVLPETSFWFNMSAGFRYFFTQER